MRLHIKQRFASLSTKLISKSHLRVAPCGRRQAGTKSAFVLAAFLLSGCGSIALHPAKQDPINVQESPLCEQACTEPALPITADPDSALDAAVNEHELRKLCEVRRKSCSDALKRGKDAGAIK